MPNWTSNSIRARGTEADLRAFLEAVKWEDEIFDFNRIIPMPELLKHAGTGRRTIEGQQVEAWYVVSRDPENILDETVRLFSPEEEAELNKIGHRSWYSWSIENWGTKWNACDVRLKAKKITEGFIEIEFETAWAPPKPIIAKMFSLFPRLSFTCRWKDEDESQWHSINHEPTKDHPDHKSALVAAGDKLAKLTERDLKQFTGTEHWYRHGINREVLFTDGAKFVADEGGAYWLLDIIALSQGSQKVVGAEAFQVWKLVVHPDHAATLTCEDGDGNGVFKQQIPFTDFPFDEMTLWFENNTIYLPSER